MHLWRRLFTGLQRFLYPDPALFIASGGQVAVEPHPAREQYSSRNAMAAFSHFPWVRAAVEAIATDLSGVPLVAERVDANGEREMIPDHWMLRLLRNPHPRCGGVRFRRQLVADLCLTGNAYIRRIGPGGTDTAVLVRLDPRATKPEVDPRSGEVTAYRWGERKLDVDDVFHIADISVGEGIHAAVGSSPIHALHDSLVAAREARRHARLAAKRGRNEVLLAPTDPRAQFGDTETERVRDRYVEAGLRGDGVLVMNKVLSATILSNTPRDLEFQEVDNRGRDETLADFGVAPVRAQQPTANYGTAKQQMRQLWENHKHKAALIDEVLTLMAGGSVRIRHDFANVESLQTQRTEAQMRAAVWVTAFGMDPKRAAAYEGFPDAPVPPNQNVDDLAAPRRPATEVDEPQAAGLEEAVVRYLHLASFRYQALAVGGEIPAQALLVETRLAEAVLREVDVDAAADWAEELAKTVYMSVRMYVDEANGDGVLGVRTLKVFDPQHARRLARLVSGRKAA